MRACLFTLAVLIASAASAFAQGHVLDDGTIGTKVVVFNQDGSEASGGVGGGGDASASNQDEQTALLTTIDADTSNVATSLGAVGAAASLTGAITAQLRAIGTTGIPVTSSALPTGAATAANQTTEIAALALLATETTAQSIDASLSVIVSRLATDPNHDAAVSTSGPQLMLESKDFDGSALPNTVSAEGEAVRFAGSLSGVAYNMPVSEDGSVAAYLLHDAVDTGLLTGVGYRSIAHGTNPTAVAAADRTVAYANRAGIPFSGIAHPNIITREWTVADADGAQTGTALVDISAGTKIVVLYSKVTCDADNTADVDFRMAFDTDGTFAAAATTGTSGIIDSQAGIPAGGGSIVTGASVGGDGEDVRYSLEDPAGGACRGVVKYYTIES